MWANRMKWHRVALSTLSLSLIGAGALSVALPAQARRTAAVAQYVYVFLENPCVNLELEQTVVTASAHSRILLAAESVATHIDQPLDQADVFSQLGMRYACLQQNDLANTYLQRALDITETVEPATFAEHEQKGRVLTSIAAGYESGLENIAQMEAALSDAIAIAETLPNDSDAQASILQGVALQYAGADQLDKAVQTVMLIRDEPARARGQQMLDSYQATFDESREESAAAAQAAIEEELFREVPIDELFDLFLILEIREEHLLPDDSVQEQARYQERLAEVIERYVQVIPSWPDADRRAYGFLALGQIFAEKSSDRAMGFLEKSLQALAMTDGTPAYENLPEDYHREELRLDIGAAFVQAGEVERGLSILSEVSPTENLLSPKIAVLRNVAYRLLLQEQDNYAYTVLTQSEQLISQIETDIDRSGPLLWLALTYANAENADEVERLLPQIDRLYREGAFDYYESFNWDYSDLLMTVGRYAQAISFAESFDHDVYLASLPARLLAAQQDDLAWEAFAKIQNPSDAVDALVDSAEFYVEQGKADEGFSAIAQAVDIAQTADITVLIEDDEDFLRHPRRSESYTEAEIQQLLAKCLQEERKALIRRPVENYSDIATDENLQRLIHQISDDTIRLELAAELLPLEAAWNEIRLTQEVALADDFLLQLIQWPLAPEFSETFIDIAADIHSPTVQAQALLSIDNSYAATPQPLSDEALQTLNDIEQRWHETNAVQ
ncbi:MAG: hypothetical protein AAFY33_15080 [Cyanobacteria bacterium J06643_4]